MDISNQIKWNNISYLATTTTTLLSCQVEEQHLNNVQQTNKKTAETNKSAVFDSGATSNCGMVGDIHTNNRSFF